MSILLSSTLANESSPYYALAGAVGGGVTQIVAGTNVTISPVGGTGAVTVNATATPTGFFTGMIIPWVGVAPAPAGWAICDGTTPGVPNLTGRFIIGADLTYPFGTSGGAASTLLTLNMIPDHIHVGAVLSGASVASGAGGSTVNPTAETGGITTPGYTPGTAVPTLPPYYALTYIMKL
jgi:hypothetical protein